MVAILWTAGQCSICINSSQLGFSQDDASLRPGIYWTLSSKWRWNASGVGDQTGWRLEIEDWNDTITIQEASGPEFLLRLKSVGGGSLNSCRSFIIGGRPSDSWKIDREQYFKINATSFRGADGNPVRWIINVNVLNVSGSVPQMWTDEDYSYVEVQFRVTGSERISVKGVPVDAWAVSHRNLTTGYWSRGGKHSIGFKDETLHYDKRFGFLLQATYSGKYDLKTDEGGWNENETFVASIVDSNADFSSSIQITSPVGLTVFALGSAAGGLILFAAIVRRLISRDRLSKMRTRT